jgi:hypothetical protein
MSLEINILISHLDFSESHGAVSEKQRERFHQDIKEMERRYQGQWNVKMMGGYYWTLHREIPENSHKRKSFSGKRKRQHKATESNLTCKYGNLIVF